MKWNILSAVFLTASAALGAPTPELAFEPGLPRWNIRLGKENIELISTDFGAGVTMRDASRSKACNIESAFLPAHTGGYALRGKIKVDHGEGITIKVIFYDAAKRQIDQSELVWVRMPEREPWQNFELTAYAAWPQTAFLKVFVYSWYETMPQFSVAALELAAFAPEPIPPAWRPAYKTADPKSPLITAADMMGPDGIVYPDFTGAGLVRANVYPAQVTLEAFGGKAEPGFDNHAAFQRALAALRARKGGEIRLGVGIYELGHPLYIATDNIAIRGAGPDRTKIRFNFTPGADGIRFCFVKEGETVGPKSSIIAVANAPGMIGMTFFCDGKKLREWKKTASNGNSSMDTLYLPPDTAPGEHRITAVASYRDKSTRKAQIRLRFDPKAVTPEIPEKLEAAILFSGTGFDAERIPLAKLDGKRGETIIELKYSPKYRPGDLLKIEAPLTENWRKLVRSACRWGYFRDALIPVKWVNARRVGFAQPLRIDFPLADGSFVQRLQPVRNCEVTGLALEQTENLWLVGIFFKYAENCKAADLRIEKAGRHPFHSYWSTHIELRDSEFNDVWDRDGGGAGYTSWEATFDSLMDRVTTRRMRHAPSFQWASSGNVIRRSTFLDSDAHWHAGWANQNLIEQCTIRSTRGYGGYGYGMWASFPGDGGKGPNGPRNVVYNNTISSELGSVWLGGMNENWIFAYNRFRSDNGPGIFMQSQCFDTIIRGNVFEIKNPNSPMVFLRDPDCTGVEIEDNLLVGGSVCQAGLGKAAVFKNNRKLPYGSDWQGQMPPVKTPSIYEWQLHKKGITK